MTGTNVRGVIILLTFFLLTLGSYAQNPVRKHSVGIYQVISDPNVELLNNKPTAFDSSLSHFTRFAYQNQLTRNWMINTGISSGFIQSQVIEEVHVNKAFVLGLDAAALLTLNNGRIIKENARVAPYLTFGHRLDYLPTMSEKDLSPWISQNQYGLGFNVRLGKQVNMQLQGVVDQKLKDDFNTQMRYRFGLTHVVGYKNNLVDPIVDNEIISKKKEGTDLDMSATKRLDSALKEIDSLKIALAEEKEKTKSIGSDTIYIEKSYDDSSEKNEDKIDNRNYYVVLSSTKQLDKAKIYKQRYSTTYKDIRILPQENGYNRIGVYMGKNRVQALNVVREARENGFPKAWISYE